MDQEVSPDIEYETETELLRWGRVLVEGLGTQSVASEGQPDLGLAH